jgi:hypothetical protein
LCKPDNTAGEDLFKRKMTAATATRAIIPKRKKTTSLLVMGFFGSKPAPLKDKLLPLLMVPLAKGN